MVLIYKMKERLFWIGCVIGLIVFFKKCNNTTCPEIKKVVYDTNTIKGKDSIVWKTPRERIITRTIHDSFGEYGITTMLVDTAAILKDYFSKFYYEDTTSLQYAKIITQDTVTENRITRHRVLAEWNIPVVTKTVSYSLPRKNEIYAGLNFGFNNVGANLSFKDTSNRVWEIGAIYMGKMFYYIGKKWKIK